NYFPVLATFRLAFLVAGVAIGTYVYDRLRRGQPLTILAPEVRRVGYLLAWVLATMPLGLWPGGSFGVLADLYSKTLAIFLLIARGLQIASVIVPLSRAGFLSLATILGTYFWTVSRRPERGWAYAALIVVVSALPLLPASYLTRLSTITNMEADATGSAQERY